MSHPVPEDFNLSKQRYQQIKSWYQGAGTLLLLLVLGAILAWTLVYVWGNMDTLLMQLGAIILGLFTGFLSLLFLTFPVKLLLNKLFSIFVADFPDFQAFEKASKKAQKTPA